MNMRSKVLLEAELHVHSPKDRHNYNYTNMVILATQVEQAIFTRLMIEVIPTANGRSDLKIHANSNSKPISSLLLTRK